MTYRDALEALFGLTRFGEKMDLSVPRALNDALGRPLDAYRSVIVGGTNGKGSTSAFLDGLLRASGLRVGLFTSPHLVSFRERVRVDGALIAEDAVADLTPRVLAAPRDPYDADGDEPHRRGPSGLRQYPVSVAAGVPLIGTAFTALGRAGSLAAVAAGHALRRHLTLEFHAVDLLGLRDDGLDPALAVQPDLKAPVARKRRVFRHLLRWLARRRAFVRLDSLP